MTSTGNLLKTQCWFCRKEIGETEEVIFSTEFDTYLHEPCLAGVLEKDPSHREARIIAREFDLPVPIDSSDNYEY